MKLIADSGSTKTSWCLIENNGNKRISTSGINPFFRNTDEIANELRLKLLPETGKYVTQIYFYGAGIINVEKGKIISDALLQLYPQTKIEVHSDLLAAARSTLQHETGIACILGTGSNSCLYNGFGITAHVRPLGFILGDEGSGAVLGRKLVADFLKGIMPGNIAAKFSLQFPFEYAELMESIYRQEKPNQFLARFVPFIHENIADNYCSALVENAFDEFILRNVAQYNGYRQQPVCFTGSVAHYFQKQLKIVLERNRLQLKMIVKEPMEGLIAFHAEN